MLILSGSLDTKITFSDTTNFGRNIELLINLNEVFSSGTLKDIKKQRISNNVIKLYGNCLRGSRDFCSFAGGNSFENTANIELSNCYGYLKINNCQLLKTDINK